MGNSHKEKDIHNDLTYLLCPGCFTRVPIINIFFENYVPKVKVSCTCNEIQSCPSVMDVSDYINKMRYRDPLLMHCSFHQDKKPTTFCLNCEKWLCEECLKESHNKKTCKHVEDPRFQFCTKHIESKLSCICKKCQKIMCDKCAEEHVAFWEKHSRDSIVKGKKHTIKIFDNFLTKEKIEKKISKFKVFKIEVMKINGEKMNEFIKKVNTQNTPNEETKEENSVPTQYQEQIEEAYNQNKEINEGLIDLIQILFNNIDFQLLLPITNKAFLMNVILNTSFNTDDIDDLSKDCKTVQDEFNCLVKIYHTYYLNKTLSYQLSKMQSLQCDSESISLVFNLEKNKFAIAVETVIQIWSGANFQKIGTLVGHTNVIQSLCNISEDKIASSSSDKAIKIWNISTQECLNTININGMPSFLFHNKINQDEIGFVNFGKTIEIWEIESKKQERVISFDSSTWFENFYQLKNGKVILGQADSFILLNENGFTTEKEIKDIGDDPSMFTELDDTKIAAGFKNGNIIIYEDNMTNSYSLVGHNKSITGVVKIKDDFALSCSVDTTMKVWNLTTLECEETFVMNKFEINYMIKLNDNKIVTCINENNLDIWNFESFSN